MNVFFGSREPGYEYIVRPGTYGIGFGKQVEGEMVHYTVDSPETLKQMPVEEREALYVGLVKTPRGLFIPGGGIEEGEDHEFCLKREFIEETGYEVEIKAFIGIGRLAGITPKSGRRVELEGHFYLIDYTQRTGGQVEDDHEFMWIPYEKAKADILLEHQRYVFNSLFDIQNQ